MNPRFKDDKEYRQIWKLVEGAVNDTIHCHPDYFRTNRTSSLRQSLSKRVAGTIRSYLAQSQGGSASKGTG